MNVGILLLVVFGSFLGLFALVLLFVKFASDDWIHRIAQKTQPIGSILSIVPSISVALGAAVAALVTGNIAANIADDQGYQRRVDAINKEFSELGIALSYTIRAAESLFYSAYVGVFSETPERYGIGVDDEQVRSRIEFFLSALDGLDRALHNLQLSAAAIELLTIGETEREQSASVYLAEQMPSGFSSHESGNLDLVTFRYLIQGNRETFEQRIGFAKKIIQEAYCIALVNGAEAPLESGGAAEDLHYIAFAGYLISVIHNSRSGYVYSAGLALLHDLFFALPNAEDIMEYLSGVHRERNNTVAYFDRNKLISGRHVLGMKELSKRLDLMYFNAGQLDCERL